MLVFIVAFSGCTAFQRKTADERAAETAARELLTRLKYTNQDLKHFKGIGRIRLAAEAAPSINERMLWVGSVPAKLSAAILVSGLPVIKFASDGRHLYFVDLRTADSNFYKIRSSDPQLSRLISIPIRSSDIVMLLAGRLPVRSHSAVRQKMANDGSRVLILERWWQVVQKIHVDAATETPQKIEFFDSQGNMTYQVVLENRYAVAAYTIPRRIHIAGANGSRLSLHIEKLFPDIDIQPGTFILAPPDRNASATIQ